MQRAARVLGKPFEELTRQVDLPEDAWFLYRYLDDAVRKKLANIVPLAEEIPAISKENEATLLSIYEAAPPRMRSRILRGEFDLVPLKVDRANFRRLLGRLRLTKSQLATALRTSGATIFNYTDDSFYFPHRVYVALLKAGNGEEALSQLKNLIARATAVYILRYPYHANLFQ